MSSSRLCDLNNPEHPLVEGAARQCTGCQARLCLRQQVINLTLGNTEEMYCLGCLAEENRCQPLEVMTNVMEYVRQRDCFKKEWMKYRSIDYCPAQNSCFPSTCFAREMTMNTEEQP